MVLSIVFFPQEEEDIDLRTIKTELKVPPRSDSFFIKSGVEDYSDLINDMSLYVFHLIDMSVELCQDLSANTDTTDCFIVQAADIRKDNKRFVGDFVLNGEKLASGKRKTGYCAIIDGKLSIGMADNDEMMNRCITEGGSFFRQYPLVSNGVMQENKIKGKSIRRALAQKGDRLYIIETEERESMHDFAEALQDMGMTDAISLVGGDAYMYWLQNGELYESYDFSEVTNRNFIVFKKKNKE